MGSASDNVWFLGDLSDAWIVSIAETVARSAAVMQVHVPGDLPETPFEPGAAPSLIIIHRHRLTSVDFHRLRDYRDTLTPAGVQPFVILCFSPFVRYEEIERNASLVDALVSEADANEVLPRRVTVVIDRRETRAIPPAAQKVRIEVAGGNHDLCQSVVAACAAAGYRANQVAGLETLGAIAAPEPVSAVIEPVLTVWDVPVLEPDWPDRLRHRASPTAPVLALIGFADRDVVTLAKANGACACLELPYDVDDLIDVIDRTASMLSVQVDSIPSRREPPHRLPPPPKHRRNTAAPAIARSRKWSDEDRTFKVK